MAMPNRFTQEPPNCRLSKFLRSVRRPARDAHGPFGPEPDREVRRGSQLDVRPIESKAAVGQTEYLFMT